YGQAVEIDYRTPGGTNDIKRLLENTYAPYRDKDGKLPEDVPADIDIVWGGGDYFFYSELRRLGSPPMNVLQGIRIDPKILAVAFLMVVQRRMADAEEALLQSRPELAAMARADVVKHADYQNAIAKGWKQGMSDLFRIAANARYFSDSAFLVPNDVANGEAAA